MQGVILVATKIPYVLAPGLLKTVLQKIQAARKPERFTQDFLGTKLGHSSGSAQAIIPFLKKMKFLGSDGVPTALYDQFRNEETQGPAVAEGMRNAFAELFVRNEYIYELSEEKLAGTIVEITGNTKEDRSTKATVRTFLTLKEFANFEVGEKEEETLEPASQSKYTPDSFPVQQLQSDAASPSTAESVLHIGYTINLNLPETSDPEVFNAIFRSLRDNLLRK